MINAVELTQNLIRCASVTPADAGALSLLALALEAAGFTIKFLPFGEGSQQINNLYARYGSGAPHFAFAGHTDVVPAGEGWSLPPFSGEIKDNMLYGRGAVDMKGAVAAFAAAAASFILGQKNFNGSISLLITGDEEGRAEYGTKPLMAWLAEQKLLPDVCVVGEPSSQEYLGDCLRIGRRGSLAAELTVYGQQGHAAYPERADNPLPRLMALLNHLAQWQLDAGNADFAPSILTLTSIDVGNTASNVIPPNASAKFNVRFNNLWRRAQLEETLKALCEKYLGEKFELSCTGDSEAFLIADSPFRTLVSNAIERVTARKPALSTGGGTSDARFIAPHCAVVEFGLVGQTMHQIDERVSLVDLQKLEAVYFEILRDYFAP